MGAQSDEASGRLDRKDVSAAKQAIAVGSRKAWTGGLEYEAPVAYKDPLAEAARWRFRETVESRQYEYGHGGYSGTFAEKHDLEINVLRKDLTSKQWHTLTRYVRDYDGKFTGPIVTVAKKLGIGEHVLLGWRGTYDDKWGPALMLVAPDRRYWIGGSCSS